MCLQWVVSEWNLRTSWKSSGRLPSLGPIRVPDSDWILDQFSSVQSLSHVRLFETPWIATHQASLFITKSQSSLRLMAIESVMPSSHLILCRPLLLLPPIPPSIRVFSSESALRMMWPKYWSFSFSIIPSKEHPRQSYLSLWNTAYQHYYLIQFWKS